MRMAPTPSSTRSRRSLQDHPKARSGGWRTSYFARTRSSAEGRRDQILDDRHAADEQFIERFRREARTRQACPSRTSLDLRRGEAEGTY